jgi:hypothetical protein
MYQYHRDAHQILLSVSADELNDYLNLHLAWSSSLIRSYNLSFADWLQSPLQETQYKQLAQRCQQLQLDKLPPLGLQPYINLLKVSSEAMDDDYNNLHHFILDPTTTTTNISKSRAVLSSWSILSRLYGPLCPCSI